MEIRWNRNADFLEVAGRRIPCSCEVRNDVNGLRPPNNVVYTINADGSKGVPYHPRRFPVGSWRVTEILMKVDPYMAPFFIATDAWQVVDAWALDTHGHYLHKIGQAADHGYGLHFSVSKTTLGCVKVMVKQDLLDLVDLVRAARSKGEAVTFEVYEA